MKKYPKWLQVVLVLVVVALAGYGINTVATGFSLSSGETKSIDAHGVCKKVSNTGGSLFVPTKTSGEWDAFRNKAPSHIGFSECCSNECSPSGAKTCSGSTALTCGNYDSDSCLEWGASQDCGGDYCTNTYGGNYCSGNAVYRNEICYSRGCSGGSCYNNRADQARLVQTCNSDQYCSGGSCITCEDKWEMSAENSQYIACSGECKIARLWAAGGQATGACSGMGRTITHTGVNFGTSEYLESTTPWGASPYVGWTCIPGRKCFMTAVPSGDISFAYVYWGRKPGTGFGCSLNRVNIVCVPK